MDHDDCLSDGHSIDIYTDEYKGVLILTVDCTIEYEGARETFEIKYCPFCGRQAEESKDDR